MRQSHVLIRHRDTQEPMTAIANSFALSREGTWEVAHLEVEVNLTLQERVGCWGRGWPWVSRAFTSA